MSTAFTATTPALPRAIASAISDALEQAAWPEALAVSMTEMDEARDLWNVQALYEAEPTPDEIHQALEFAGLDRIEITIGQLPDTDWVRESLSGLAPVVAGRLFVHGSHDRHLRPAAAISLEIDAGLAFGTGHHHTTRGCLLALQDVLKHMKPRSILDVGCGSGVLAIAAATLTRSPAIASDIDAEAIPVARDNAVINATGHLVRCLQATGIDHCEIRRNQPYDLVFANILAGPLVALAPDLSAVVARRGRLILAGLTSEQSRQVIAAYRAQDMIVTARRDHEGWAILTLAHMQKGTA
jgi:ribosomal protein L11 methyltransferase